ncbi:pappalysin-2 [Sigmodon hispidus]
MMCWKILRVTLVVLAGWAFSTTNSELGWTRKKLLVQRGQLNQVLLEGEHCWLGTKIRRPRTAPQNHLFGVYPNRPQSYLRSYASGKKQTSYSGWRQQGVEGQALTVAPRDVTENPAEVRGEPEQPAALWVGDGPIGQSELLKDDDTYLGNGGSKEALGEPATRGSSETSASTTSTFADQKRPTAETQRKGQARSRLPRHLLKRQAGDRARDPQNAPLGFKLWPKSPFKHRDSDSPLEGTIQNGEGGSLQGAETFNPQGGLPVLYFSGKRERLLLRPEVLAEIPREAFTVEAWVRPEGGQSDPAIIAGVFDNCSHTANDKGWALGILSGKNKGRRDARFFFSLRTDRVKKATIVSSHSHYQPGKWVRVAATYDGQHMALYVDGTRVASSPDQSGPLNSPFMASCRSLLLGGDSSEDGHFFRGFLGTLTIWSTALSQIHLQHSLQHASGADELTTLILTATFNPLKEQWAPFRDETYPRLEVLQDSESQPEILSPLQPPLCGQTACDNVELISQYNEHGPLRGQKVIRYQVVNICDDEGLHPIVSDDQIRRQHQALNEAFNRYNISWQLNVHRVHNSTLRHRVVLVNCEPSKIGNDHCDAECEDPLTGYDGGDCRLQHRCHSWNRRDGVCHMECNNMLNDFDDGDCCDPEVTDVRKTCFDPDSPKR